MLLNFDNKVPEIFNLTKTKKLGVLAQYFYKDGTFALFNGTNNYSYRKN